MLCIASVRVSYSHDDEACPYHRENHELQVGALTDRPNIYIILSVLYHEASNACYEECVRAPYSEMTSKSCEPRQVSCCTTNLDWDRKLPVDGTRRPLHWQCPHGQRWNATCWDCSRLHRTSFVWCIFILYQTFRNIPQCTGIANITVNWTWAEHSQLINGVLSFQDYST